MSKILKLYNTFTKALNNVELSGKLISANDQGQAINGSFYICGPTVYSDCHLGHGLTYIRADLFRRFMKATFNVNLLTAMNITDIDDKILEKTRQQELHPPHATFPTDPASHHFNKLSERYYKSFLDDMKSIRILPADLYIKVSKQIPLIINYISELERKGYAYRTEDGDVRFRVSKLESYVPRLDARTMNDNNPDFVLWKAAKPGEPRWMYRSHTDGSFLPGRPGWHVQCSAISSSLFGNQLDFHYGGKDLIFPHHYNEEACSCAFHSLNTSNSLHVWANHWLHSGHLVLEDKKMSKSLGNVVPIRNFLTRSSVNALRLMCIQTHYRSDIVFGDDLLDRLKALDHKISAFVAFIKEKLERVQEILPSTCSDEFYDKDLELVLIKTQEEILDGLCDDFHTDRGLDSILCLSKVVYSKDADNISPRDLLAIWYMLQDWCAACGLDYGFITSSCQANDEILSKTLFDFRSNVRALTLNELKSGRGVNNSGDNIFRKLLKECDNVRAQMDELGFVLRDPKS